MKTTIALFCYGIALFFVYAAFQLAPDMKWPTTDLEVTAAIFMTTGCIAKLIGHVILLSTARAR
jgi:hypothetical protein